MRIDWRARGGGRQPQAQAERGGRGRGRGKRAALLAFPQVATFPVLPPFPTPAPSEGPLDAGLSLPPSPVTDPRLPKDPQGPREGRRGVSKRRKPGGVSGSGEMGVNEVSGGRPELPWASRPPAVDPIGFYSLRPGFAPLRATREPLPLAVCLSPRFPPSAPAAPQQLPGWLTAPPSPPPPGRRHPANLTPPDPGRSPPPFPYSAGRRNPPRPR